MLRENLRGPPGMLGKEGKTGAPGRTVSSKKTDFSLNSIKYTLLQSIINRISIDCKVVIVRIKFNKLEKSLHHF